MSMQAPIGSSAEIALSFWGRIKGFFRSAARRCRPAAPLFVIAAIGLGAQLLPEVHAGRFFVSLNQQPLGGEAFAEVTDLSLPQGQSLRNTAFLWAPLSLMLGNVPLDNPNIFIDETIFDDEGNFFFASLSPLTTTASRNDRHSTFVHTVQEQESLSIVAAQYGVTVNTLVWANNGFKNPDLLRPGDVLVIPPVSGVLHAVKSGDSVASIAKKYSADADKIITFNGLPADGALQIDVTLVVPDGRILPPPAKPKPVTPRYAQSGGAPNEIAGYYRLPLSGRRVRGLSRYHRGVDIAAPCGTAIYAAADGTVTRSDPTGWNGGFGKVIVMKHPNGTETLYAHGSAIYVEVGENIVQGQAIMATGTTGQSTGCHLHLEVHGAGNPF